jgi:hypothetical protein
VYVKTTTSCAHSDPSPGPVKAHLPRASATEAGLSSLRSHRLLYTIHMLVGCNTQQAMSAKTREPTHRKGPREGGCFPHMGQVRQLKVFGPAAIWAQGVGGAAAHDGREKGGEEGDGHAIPQGRQGREGGDARRVGRVYSTGSCSKNGPTSLHGTQKPTDMPARTAYATSTITTDPAAASDGPPQQPPSPNSPRTTCPACTARRGRNTVLSLLAGHLAGHVAEGLREVIR